MDYQNSSFKVVLIGTFFFLAPYIALKCTLTLFLQEMQFSLDDAYSITTAASITYALSAVYFGILSKQLSSSNTLMKFGSTIVLLGFIFIITKIKILIFLGLALYVTGSSIFILNTNLTVNNIYSDVHERQGANHIYQLIFNMGGMIGMIGFSIFDPQHYLSLYIFAALFVLMTIASILPQKTANQSSPTTPLTIQFFLALLLGILFVFELLMHGHYARFIVIIAFALCFIYILHLSMREKNPNYRTFLILISTCSVVYWITANILYSQFTVFLQTDVNQEVLGYKIPPMIALLSDPIANLIFGWLVYVVYKKYPCKPSTMLITGLMFGCVAFFGLTYAMYLTTTAHKVWIVWPIIAISIFATGEFLILTTLTSQISSLVVDSKRQGFFMGVLRLVNAFGATISFYLMRWSETTANSNIAEMSRHNMNLYFLIGLLSLFALLSYIYLVFSKRIKV